MDINFKGKYDVRLFSDQIFSNQVIVDSNAKHSFSQIILEKITDLEVSVILFIYNNQKLESIRIDSNTGYSVAEIVICDSEPKLHLSVLVNGSNIPLKFRNNSEIKFINEFRFICKIENLPWFDGKVPS